MPRSMARLFMVVLGQIALLAGAILIMTPVLYMVSASFMTNDEIFSTRFQILPSNLNWGNYIEVFARFNFMRYLSNSVFVTGAIVFLNLLFSPMIGYSLAKFDYPGKNILMLFILATVMVPFTAILIPLFPDRSRSWMGQHISRTHRSFCYVGIWGFFDATIHH